MIKYHTFPFSSPVVTEGRVIEHNFLKQLNKFIRKVSSHEGLHCDRDIFRVLSLGQSRLDNLQGSQNLLKRSNKIKIQSCNYVICYAKY